MDAWHLRTGEIHSRFFRSGLYTHLWIDPDIADGVLRWRYQFMDLGMCHVIEREYSVREINRCGTEEEKLSFVFSGHYSECVQALHAELLAH